MKLKIKYEVGRPIKYHVLEIVIIYFLPEG